MKEHHSPIVSADDMLPVLRDSARRYLARHWPAEQSLTLSHDVSAFRTIHAGAAAQGWFALGAQGPALRETAVILEECGRAACALPVAEAYVVNRLLASSALVDKASLLDSVANGQTVVALSSSIDENGGYTLATFKHCAGRRVTLNGVLRNVEAAQIATHILLLDAASAVAALIPCAQPGISVKATPGYAIPPRSTVELHNTSADLLEAGCDHHGTLIRVLLALRAYGSAQRTFELAVEHAKTRHQFGQPIGHFQAIQHKLANGLINLEAARVLLAQAAEAHDCGDSGWHALADAAVTFCSPALRQVALEAHHTLAGVGYFDEHEAPRHFRRIHSDLVSFGGVYAARKALAEQVLPRNSERALNDMDRLPSADFGPAANALRTEVRHFLSRFWGPEQRAAQAKLPPEQRGASRAFSNALRDQGWLGLAWPRRFGGQARSWLEMLAFSEEMGYANVPTSVHGAGTGMIGPAIMEYGTPSQCERFLPAILNNEMTFCLGYSEPEAGSDLASLRTRAVRDGDSWIINGAKLYTTATECANYVWIAARTDAQAPKHKGISVFAVPLDTPGITIHPKNALYGKTAAAVFYDDVRVPGDALIGEINGGWKIITAALAHERVVMGGLVAKEFANFNKLRAAIRSTRRDGRPMSEDPVVRERVGLIAAELRAARGLALQAILALEQGRIPTTEAAISKVFSSELQERIGETVLDLFGPEATLEAGDGAGALDGTYDYSLRESIMRVVGAGTNEIQRTIIATVGLGLPR